MKIGRRIYYDISTGNIIIDTGYRQGSVVPTTIEQDIATYKALSERNRDTFDVLELEYDQFAQDFTEASSYRVNTETKELEFSYPDPNDPEAPPVFQKPLSEEVEELKRDKNLLKLQVDALTGHTDFLEEAITELILTVVP